MSRLELQKFFNFSAAHSPVRLDIETKFLIFQMDTVCMSTVYANDTLNSITFKVQ